MSLTDARLILDRQLAAGEISQDDYDALRARIGKAAESNVGLQANAMSVDPSVSSRQAANNPDRHGALLRTVPLIIIRLWRGEIPLPITYWVAGGVGGTIFLLIGAGLITLANTMALAVMAAAIPLAYEVFITVAIIRSATAYRKIIHGAHGSAFWRKSWAAWA